MFPREAGSVFLSGFPTLEDEEHAVKWRGGGGFSGWMSLQAKVRGEDVDYTPHHTILPDLRPPPYEVEVRSRGEN
jgi:hypothetical protein